MSDETKREEMKSAIEETAEYWSTDVCDHWRDVAPVHRCHRCNRLGWRHIIAAQLAELTALRQERDRLKEALKTLRACQVSATAESPRTASSEGE